MIVNRWPPLMDGVGDYTHQLSLQLVEQGNEIAVLCNATVAQHTVKEQGITVLPVIQNWNALETIGRLNTALREQQPEVVIWQYVPHAFHDKGLPYLAPVLIAQCRRFTTTLVFFHEVRTKINPSRIKSILLGGPMYILSALIHSIANASATSNPGYLALLKAYGKVARMIPIGSNIPAANQREAITTGRQFILGAFGMNLRGQEAILDALSQMKGQHEGVQLLVIGGVSKKAQSAINQRAKELGLNDRIRFTGFLPIEALAEQLDKVNLYLMLEPSHSADTWTGTSTRSGTLAAAMARGLPVLGVRGELSDPSLEEVFFWLDELNGHGLVRIFERCLNDRNLLTEKGKSSKKYFERYLTWPHIANQYMNWINEYRPGS